MLNLGKTQTLTIAREKDFGVYLEDGEGQSVLLPARQVPKGKTVGDTVEVFLYKDSRDRMIATTRKPLMEVGEIANVHYTDKSDVYNKAMEFLSKHKVCTQVVTQNINQYGLIETKESDVAGFTVAKKKFNYLN